MYVGALSLHGLCGATLQFVLLCAVDACVVGFRCKVCVLGRVPERHSGRLEKQYFSRTYNTGVARLKNS